MNTSGIRMLGLALVFLAGHSLAGLAHAQEPGALKITNAVFQEVEVKAADGKVTTKRIAAAKVVPGGEVIYEIAYSNSGTETATDLAINNPMPEALLFVDDGKTPATAVSVDGGETFGKLADLFVIGENGEPRAAQASDVTNLRWIVATLAPGAKGMVSFRARVR